jgi:muramoyltetrapeptide carboxypeptidase
VCPGDRVAVVAPAGPVPRDAFAAGSAILGARYQLVHSERIFEQHGFFAGDDAARRAELQAALDDPSVRAVICARGGYGMMRIAAGLDAAGLRAAPKPIVGFSDITVLHAWAARQGLVSVHGPVVIQVGKLPSLDVESLFALLESPEPPPQMTGLRALAPGAAEGPLIGGNLELMSRLVGTPLLPPLAGAVLLLEEVGERPYRIDRALTQLALAGALDQLAGVVIGDLVLCEEKDGSPPNAEEVVLERLSHLGVPVVAGAPIGHGTRNRALPHGARVRLDAASGTLTFLEGAVAP